MGAIAKISHLPILSAREDVELVGCMANTPKVPDRRRGVMPLARLWIRLRI